MPRAWITAVHLVVHVHTLLDTACRLLANWGLSLRPKSPLCLPPGVVTKRNLIYLRQYFAIPSIFSGTDHLHCNWSQSLEQTVSWFLHYSLHQTFRCCPVYTQIVPLALSRVLLIVYTAISGEDHRLCSILAARVQIHLWNKYRQQNRHCSPPKCLLKSLN